MFLKGKNALVTGSTSGIGLAIARALAAKGANLVINGFGDADEIERTRAALEQASHGRALYSNADLTKPEAIEAMMAEAAGALGSIDILVNNAGMAAVRGLDDITEEDFDRMLAVNLKSAFLCTQAVLPAMRKRGWGRIINVSSIGARIGAGSISVAYGASKAGLEGLTRSYALRLAPEGVTVNAIAPGLIDTDMGKPLIEAGVAGRIPVGRAGTGEEIARAVLFLAGNAFVTGQTIAVNGGSLFS